MSGTESTNKSSNREAKHRVRLVNHLGEIFAKYVEDYIVQYRPDLQKIKLLRAMRICKSPFLGGRAIVCKSCHNHHYVYHSCGHSHCPICQSIKREQWIDRLRKELLNVGYVHMIFTLPHQLHGLAKSNKWEIYSLILRSSWETVKVLSEKKENIGALAGMVSVLHTFGADMKYHIHTHNLVTFGGLDQKTNKWKRPQRKDRIAGYRDINRTYRDKFMEGLEELYAKGKINYHKTYEEIEEEVKSITWVVHNTKPTIDTGILEDYLARYINRIAVSNSKVEWLKNQSKVKLIYNDYRNQKEGMVAPKAYKLIDPLVFIDQFLQHVLPPYFQKTRRYGLHSSASKRKYKELIPNHLKREGEVVRTVIQIVSVLLNKTPYMCEKCESELFEIIMIRPEKDWIDQYIKVPKPRPPREGNPKTNAK